MECLISGFVPDVGAMGTVAVGERAAFEVIVGQHTECRNDVFPEVLVLVVAPDQRHVGIESVQLGTDPPEALDQLVPVAEGGGIAIVVTPLLPHGLGPILRILPLRRNAVIL